MKAANSTDASGNMQRRAAIVHRLAADAHDVAETAFRARGDYRQAEREALAATRNRDAAHDYRAEMTVHFAIWEQITGAAGPSTTA